jgi:hypothetical protein
MGKPVISLRGLDQLALIVEHPSGVLYTSQAGGVSCMHPVTEGVLVPIGSGCRVEEKLEAFFAENAMPQLPAHADALDWILRTPDKPYVVTPTFFLEVDRSRLHESMEAWLFVTVVACPDEHMISFSSDRDGRLSNIWTLSGRAWSPDDQPELGPHPTGYPLTGFGRRSAVLTWPNSD